MSAAHRTRLQYIIPDQVTSNELVANLRKNTRLIAQPARIVQRIYYDTFDWRLHANNSVLEEQQDNKKHTLIRRDLGGSDNKAQIVLSTPARFVWDLPAGPFRAQLEPVLEMRALTPLCQIVSKTHVLRVLNKIDKTVVHLLIEENAVRRRKGGKTYRLGNRVTVLPIKGYQKSCAKIVNTLENIGLLATTEDPVLTALALVGLTPGDYSSKLNLRLQPGRRADQTSRIILRRLLDVMVANETGTLKGTDTEFLHDFRVAVRRTRSALGQIKGVLPLRILKRYRAEFAWLGQVSSPLRDLDVWLLKFDDYQGSLPDSVRTDIEPLRDFLGRQRQIEHKALQKVLQSARYRRLVKGWRQFLDTPVSERSTLQNARRPTLDLARERIWRTYRRVIKEGRAIESDTPAEALHELRKSGKKLRYLMEFFQSLFPPVQIKKLIKALKTLQVNLGDLQDYHVQVTALQQYSQRMVVQLATPAATLLAMGMLIEGLERRQQHARREFAGRFRQFSRPENRARFRELFATHQAEDQGKEL